MRIHPISGLVLFLGVSVIARHALAAEKPKSAAYKAYQEKAGTIAANAIETELSRRRDRPNDIRLELKFQVDRGGRVQNASVIPNHPNQWAQDTARRVLAELKLPPVPPKLAAELGAGSMEVKATLVMGVVHTGDKSVVPDSPDTVAYIRKVDAIICAALQAEVLKRQGPISADITIALVVDRNGRVCAQEIRSAGSSE